MVLPDKFEETVPAAFIMERQQCLVININPISHPSSLVHPYSAQHSQSLIAQDLAKCRQTAAEQCGAFTTLKALDTGVTFTDSPVQVKAGL